MTHKLGIEVLELVNLAYEVDYKIGTDFGRKSISKEILKVNVFYIEKDKTPDQICSGEANGYIGFQ